MSECDEEKIGCEFNSSTITAPGMNMFGLPCKHRQPDGHKGLASQSEASIAGVVYQARAVNPRGEQHDARANAEMTCDDIARGENHPLGLSKRPYINIKSFYRKMNHVLHSHSPATRSRRSCMMPPIPDHVGMRSRAPPPPPPLRLPSQMWLRVKIAVECCRCAWLVYVWPLLPPPSLALSGAPPISSFGPSVPSTSLFIPAPSLFLHLLFIPGLFIPVHLLYVLPPSLFLLFHLPLYVLTLVLTRPLPLYSAPSTSPLVIWLLPPPILVTSLPLLFFSLLVLPLPSPRSCPFHPPLFPPLPLHPSIHLLLPPFIPAPSISLFIPAPSTSPSFLNLPPPAPSTSLFIPAPSTSPSFLPLPSLSYPFHLPLYPCPFHLHPSSLPLPSPLSLLQPLPSSPPLPSSSFLPIFKLR
ncbi:hypothetical protein C7M84_013862 [Penaeus vannamei]|uniref:Uncharacterized protein n=1 Tax=Penaeus vannamei TaxID=6689 RepID=A0A3R7M058_PENVA|nr:hypothetical protein C7M84_013862 [Penaeus vannamei]